MPPPLLDVFRRYDLINARQYKLHTALCGRVSVYICKASPAPPRWHLPLFLSPGMHHVTGCRLSARWVTSPRTIPIVARMLICNDATACAPSLSYTLVHHPCAPEKYIKRSSSNAVDINVAPYQASWFSRTVCHVSTWILADLMLS